MKAIKIGGGLLIVIPLLSFVAHSCQSEEGNMHENLYTKSDGYYSAKVEIKRVTDELKANSYDGQSINVEVFEEIMSKETGWTKEEIVSKETICQTRSIDDVLSVRQQKLLDEFNVFFSGRKEITDDDVALFIEKCQILPKIEQEEFVAGLITAQLILEVLDESIVTRMSMESFACNLATSTLSGVYGEWAAGIAIACGAIPGGAVAWGVGFAVAAISGSILGTTVCG